MCVLPLNATKARCGLWIASHSALASTLAFAELVARERCRVVVLLLEGNPYVHTNQVHFAYLRHFLLVVYLLWYPRRCADPPKSPQCPLHKSSDRL